MIRASFLLGLLFPLAATLSQGTYISPDMPFMLFGSDNVGKIQFSEAPCVFIAAASGDGLSKVTFTPGNLEGPFGYSVNASIFADTVTFVNGDSNVKAQFGAFCFPDNTGYLRTDFGNYTGLDSTSPQWRSTLLYFMPKKSVTGPCKGKGTHKLGGNVFILFDRAVAVDASSECPAVVLAPSNIQFDLAYSQTGCVGIGFSRQSNSIDIDISTVQNGASPLKDATFLTWKANDKSSSNVQTFLRNAVLLRTNSSSWISNIAKLSYENTYNDDANTCKLSRSLDDFATSASGRIDTDPYGSEQMIYTLNMPFASDHAITNFDFSDNSFDCFTMDLTITTTDAPGVNFQSTITDREQLQIINLDAITFSYKQQTMSTDSCANFQLHCLPESGDYYDYLYCGINYCSFVITKFVFCRVHHNFFDVLYYNKHSFLYRSVHRSLNRTKFRHVSVEHLLLNHHIYIHLNSSHYFIDIF
ncbi:hypothetical protein QR680_003691 [Steinernema hermaphroditum]|uniref:Uncharacterized protein n=1 Tax=Steinernema hermaphroditum TaxID=289476 RepID=A0AA39HL77_9BILA|nr:hypothetical protein QR680_003691 [Steinernema hermaphroditum]